MRRIDFKVPIYDWNITVATLYSLDDTEVYKELLESIKADPVAREESIGALQKGCVDGGDWWYDNGKRRGLLCLFPWSNKEKFWEVLNHEKRHLVDRILEYAGVHDIEAAAYLDGYVSKEIMSRLKELTT